MCDFLNIKNVHLMDLHINSYDCGIDTPIVYNENMKGLKILDIQLNFGVIHIQN